MIKPWGSRHARLIALIGVGLFASLNANAIPSFTRQTGVACEQCHTVAYGPALTPYGRQFKLNGYTFGERALPLSFMVQGGYTRTKKDQPDPPADHTSVNNNLSIDQVSLFFGGRLADHLGAFAQFTYSGPDRAFSWDNLDVRYARVLAFGNHSAIVGLTLNNNPTVQDLWNSTPAWGYPYISSALAPSPAAGNLLTGLGGAVLGTSAYAMIDDRIYLEIGGYRGLSDRWLGFAVSGPNSRDLMTRVAGADFSDAAMPFMIQTLRDQTRKIDLLMKERDAARSGKGGGKGDEEGNSYLSMMPLALPAAPGSAQSTGGGGPAF